MEITKDDLTLRDRGYLTMNEIKRHLQIGAHCIYRHKMDMKFLDYDTDKPIDLLSVLKNERSIDRLVRLNDKEKTAVRLVAMPVDQATADRRRMKAKKEMKRHNPGKLFLELQSWKSNMHFDHIQNVSKCQLIITIIMRMLMFLIIKQLIFSPLKKLIYLKMNRNVSLLKLIKYLIRNPIKIVLILSDLKENKEAFSHTTSTIARHCVYEIRKRRNFEQQKSILYA